MVMVLSLKSNTAPISCKVCLPRIRSYSGGGPPLEYSTISRRRCTFLLAEYSTKESSTSPTFLVLKVPLEVLHDSGTALLTMGMYLLDLLHPFSRIWVINNHNPILHNQWERVIYNQRKRVPNLTNFAPFFIVNIQKICQIIYNQTLIINNRSIFLYYKLS